MAGNQARGTSGLMLAFIATGMFVVAVMAWENRLTSGQDDVIAHVSGLGDHSYYDGKEGANDFHERRLVFSQQPKGIFRRDEEPQPFDDAKMLRVALERGSDRAVYTPAKQDEGMPARYFLKAGEGGYIEFGERNHWPTFTPAKASAKK